ncbi:hypothetical protein BC939DRAFT_439940, partial [Gamsiella multidivaricata]|uniref:uncharacterized protein n=1 Tax=Gamsiella multidivaricata TaxID=101098 RepID=UPI00221F8DDF
CNGLGDCRLFIRLLCPLTGCRGSPKETVPHLNSNLFLDSFHWLRRWSVLVQCSLLQLFVQDCPRTHRVVERDNLRFLLPMNRHWTVLTEIKQRRARDRER